MYIYICLNVCMHESLTVKHYSLTQLPILNLPNRGETERNVQLLHLGLRICAVTTYIPISVTVNSTASCLAIAGASLCGDKGHYHVPFYGKLQCKAMCRILLLACMVHNRREAFGFVELIYTWIVTGKIITIYGSSTQVLWYAMVLREVSKNKEKGNAMPSENGSWGY